jgi:hypothetical protein
MISWSFAKAESLNLNSVSEMEPSRQTLLHFSSSSYAQTSSAEPEVTFRLPSCGEIRMGSAIFSLLSSQVTNSKEYQKRYYFPGDSEPIARYIGTNIPFSVLSSLLLSFF